MSTDDLKAASEARGEPIEFAVLTEIAIIAHLSETAFARLLPGKLTTAQFGVLNHLIRKETSETISQIASAMQVSQPTMSSTVRKLEDNGLIELIHDKDDRRIRRVAVTKAGRAIRKQSVEALASLQDGPLTKLSSTDWETLLPALGRLRKILDAARD